jgi:hypothetical protein
MTERIDGLLFIGGIAGQQRPMRRPVAGIIGGDV